MYRTSLGLLILVLISSSSFGQQLDSDSRWAKAAMTKYDLPGFNSPLGSELSRTQVALIAFRVCNKIKAHDDEAVHLYHELNRYLKRHPNLSSESEIQVIRGLLFKFKRELKECKAQMTDSERIKTLLKSNESEFKTLGIDRNRMRRIVNSFKVVVKHLQVKEI